jgi:hypothetical protein
VHIAVGPCAKGHFIQAGTNGPGVPLLLLLAEIGEFLFLQIQFQKYSLHLKLLECLIGTQILRSP